jgi:hypothetical protein
VVHSKEGGSDVACQVQEVEGGGVVRGVAALGRGG